MFAQLDLYNFGLIMLAGILGGVIGIEREIADKPAGFRTHILVAAASALLVLLAREALRLFPEGAAEGTVEGDPTRVIQAIIVGISFLGGGTIVRRQQGESDIEGLTTAATIFLTAAIGITIGLRQIALGIETTVFAIIVLVLAHRLERFLPTRPNHSENEEADQRQG